MTVARRDWLPGSRFFCGSRPSACARHQDEVHGANAKRPTWHEAQVGRFASACPRVAGHAGVRLDRAWASRSRCGGPRAPALVRVRPRGSCLDRRGERRVASRRHASDASPRCGGGAARYPSPTTAPSDRSTTGRSPLSGDAPRGATSSRLRGSWSEDARSSWRRRMKTRGADVRKSRRRCDCSRHGRMWCCPRRLRGVAPRASGRDSLIGS